MIEILEELIPQVFESLLSGDVDRWDSLVINRRRPHTYRVFSQFDNYRVCLHRFEPCSPDECFIHPHPWPGAFLMLQGEYVHRIGYSDSLESVPTMFFTEIVRPYSIYEITHSQTWHSVQPLSRTWTIMVNGEPWLNSHVNTRTTKGKDLQKMEQDELAYHLYMCTYFLGKYINSQTDISPASLSFPPKA